MSNKINTCKGCTHLKVEGTSNPYEFYEYICNKEEPVIVYKSLDYLEATPAPEGCENAKLLEI